MNKEHFNLGESVYMDMAEASGVEPLDALINIESMLDSRWDHTEDFLEALCADEVEAIAEVRQHYGLDPLE